MTVALEAGHRFFCDNGSFACGLADGPLFRTTARHTAQYGNGGSSGTVKIRVWTTARTGGPQNNFVSNMMATTTSATLGSANLSHRQVGSCQSSRHGRRAWTTKG